MNECCFPALDYSFVRSLFHLDAGLWTEISKKCIPIYLFIYLLIYLFAVAKRKISKERFCLRPVEKKITLGIKL